MEDELREHDDVLRRQHSAAYGRYRRRRIESNEQAVRERNDAARRSAEAAGVDPLLPFVCECGNALCDDRLALSAGEYGAAHQAANRFVVAREHAITDVERVVERHEGYDVVEKLPDGPAAAGG